MTDNIITRNEAIDRMKAELPCETRRTYQTEFVWVPTVWTHFDYADGEVVFRKPPEPRRVAREYIGVVGWNSQPLGLFGTDLVADDYCKPRPDARKIKLREVLPGDVTLQRMTEAQVRAEFKERWGDRGWTVNRELCESWWIASRCALDLIGEGS